MIHKKLNIKIILIFIYYMVGIFPFYFLYVPGQTVESLRIQLTSNLRITDILLGAMFVWGIIKYFKVTNRQAKKAVFILIILYIYFFYEIIRNNNKYGINAFGEFRYTYIILLLPFWIAITFDRNEVVTTVKYFVMINLVVPIILYPLLIIYNHKTLNILMLDENNRIFPSDISLAILLSIYALYFFKKYGLIIINTIAYRFIISSTILMVIFDNHRSVWLAGIVIYLILILKREIKFSINTIIRYLIPIIIMITSLIIILLPKFLDFVKSRAIVYIDPQVDTTGSWRILQWDSQISRFYENPFLGEGLGGYWGFTTGKDYLGVMPHNMYVMILCKLGVIGLIILILFLFITLIKFKFFIKRKETSELDPIFIIGYLAVWAFLIYSIAYNMDEKATWMYFGLALALIKEQN